MAFADLVDAMDRSAMCSLGSECVRYAPQYGSAVDVTGIFSERFVLAEGTALAGVETVAPAVFLRIADLPVDPLLDEPVVFIRECAYHVTERIPDGVGGITLLLRSLT